MPKITIKGEVKHYAYTPKGKKDAAKALNAPKRGQAPKKKKAKTSTDGGYMLT